MQCVLIALSALVAVAMAGGKCSRDGFFYNDEKSFTICSNGNSYVQPCAPGSRNSGKYKHGGYAASAHSFCDVNLVDHGYAVKHGYHNHGHHGNSYGHHGSHGYGHNRGYGHHGNSYGHHGNNYGHHGSHSYGNHGYGHGHGGHGYGHGSFGHHGAYNHGMGHYGGHY